MTRRYLSFGIVLVVGLTVGCRHEAPVADQTDPAENGAVAVPVRDAPRARHLGQKTVLRRRGSGDPRLRTDVFSGVAVETVALTVEGMT